MSIFGKRVIKREIIQKNKIQMILGMDFQILPDSQQELFPDFAHIINSANPRSAIKKFDDLVPLLCCLHFLVQSRPLISNVILDLAPHIHRHVK